MIEKKYTTNKWVAIVVVIVGAFGYGIAIFGNPNGFQINFITIFLIGILMYMLFDSLYGTYVTLSNGTLSRIDNFFMKKRILIRDIHHVRYQPTYGVGKEISSLYVFSKGRETPTITMTSIWFTEAVLKQILHDPKTENPAIRFDEEAQSLLAK